MSAPPSFDLPEASAPTPGRPGQTAPPEPAKPSGPPPPIRRMADGKPDLSGFYMPDGGGGNYGLGKHEQDFLTPGGRGIIVDPPDGTLPMQPWAQAEAKSRQLPSAGTTIRRRTASSLACPRSMYVPSPLQILQPPGYARHPPRAHVVAKHSARWTRHICPTRCVSGRAIRSASGTATRWSSRRRTSMGRRG